ncbi:MAG TPA: lytic transglycosylase domain-containing protein, partial [Pyrinomonadaceae bacterium]|nr:lytic transglycosylase domain-containing protein [Pyrinomonadaceae bacterium]
LMSARAYEQQGEATSALAAYRRLYFYAPTSNEAKEAAPALARLNSTPAPANAEEALARAERLAAAGRHAEAFDAYTDALTRFPNTSNPTTQLRRAASAAQARRTTEAVSAIAAIPPSEPEARAEALFHLSQAYARGKQWPELRATVEQMRGAYPKSVWTMRALASAGTAARDAKNTADALNFFRTAATMFPGASEVAGGQFELAWAAHTSKNYQESSRLLVEHLADYADENTDNRGRAGYWAARDTERAGRVPEARALYEAMLARYDANWYGYLSKQRIEALDRSGVKSPTNVAPDSTLGRAVANLKYVTVSEETAGDGADERLAKADDLDAVGMDDAAHAELDDALRSAPTSPRLNLAKARIYRQVDKNVEAINTLKRSYPDYSQMKPEEMPRDAWDVFYPLAYWDIIVQEARARDLDPFIVAGLIRQESVFNPRAASHADAYGLMQLLVPTGRLVAQRYGLERSITVESLFEPRLNIQLGTGYMRDNLDKFGRIEYVAAAYNAGPHRAVTWRASLPPEMDEWAEAIPFRETRGYVQGVIRNTLQYRRLYDEQGRFRPEVGTLAVTGRRDERPPADVRVRRINDEEEEE